MVTSRDAGVTGYGLMRLAVAVAAASFGLLVGVAGVGFQYAEGLSYMSTDPKACVNCHIMRPQYNGWQRSSHHDVAGCADCHLPHDFPDKYIAKARNGWNHSKAFTLQNFPEPILITPPNAAILQANCERCHEGLLHDIAADGAPACTGCHDTVGHGEQVGLGGPPRPDELQEPHVE